MSPEELLCHQSAFWYLAGLEDGSARRSQHGPTTPAGKEFISAYVAACLEERAKFGYDPYLPDFYQNWTKEQR